MMPRVISLALLTAGLATAASASWKDALKKVTQPEEKGTQQQGGSKTENLIVGGLKTLQSLLPIGYEEEMAIGGAVALEAVARFGGLWTDPELEKYVATVGNAVALTSDRPEIPYFFGILNADEPNGFACPGGYVFISKGLLKLVRNEAQLAGILGHEISHVAKKHALNAIRRTKALSSVSEVTLAALDQDPKMFDSIVKEAVSMIFDKGLSKDDEREADRLGAEYAFRVGYDPRGLAEFLEVLGGAMAAHKGGVFQTHPKPGDRVAALRSVLAKPEYREGDRLPVLADRWTRIRTAASL